MTSKRSTFGRDRPPSKTIPHKAITLIARYYLFHIKDTAKFELVRAENDVFSAISISRDDVILRAASLGSCGNSPHDLGFKRPLTLTLTLVFATHLSFFLLPASLMITFRWDNLL